MCILKKIMGRHSKKKSLAAQQFLNGWTVPKHEGKYTKEDIDRWAQRFAEIIDAYGCTAEETAEAIYLFEKFIKHREIIGGLFITEPQNKEKSTAKTGKWVVTPPDSLKCSNCGEEATAPTPYCPYCGTKME